MRDIWRFAALLAVFATATTSFAQAYRWVDADGVVHYSDRPQPGAEEVVLPKPNTSRPLAPRPSVTPSSQADAPAEEPPVRYQSLEIVSPAAEETLWNIEGQLNVQVSVTPALQPGHQLRVYLDGQAQIVTSSSFQLEEVWRGSHHLQVEVIDEAGNLMIRSQANQFYVRQNTVQF